MIAVLRAAPGLAFVACVLLASPSLAATEDDSNYRAVSLAGLTSAYGAFGVWAWLAWYRDRPALPAWRVGGDGWFGADTYAGGADKLGHVWANLALTRLGAELLEGGGWQPSHASALASSLCFTAFAAIELNDGYYTEFSYGDLAGNALGVLTALGLRHVPGLDEAFDFRVQWFPSASFRREPGANFAEDYFGQTYLLAFKPRVLRAVRESDDLLYGVQFVNPVLGFQTRASTEPEAPGVRRQSLFIGATFDLQVAVDLALRDATSAAARFARSTGHALFEYANLPFSTTRTRSVSRSGNYTTR
jgi:hypothetical protein